MTVDLLGFLVIGAVWTWAAWTYRRIHGHSLKVWAVPFAHGLLLFARRAPRKWERA